MRYIFLAILFLAPQSNAVEISNFKQGLLCNDNSKQYWICHEVDEIYLTGQSTCRDNGKLESCDWHGFSFDYVDLDEAEIIKCMENYSLEQPIDKFVFESEDKLIVKKYELDVPKGSGHFFNPQNFVFGTTGRKARSAYSKTKCFVNDKMVFEYD